MILSNVLLTNFKNDLKLEDKNLNRNIIRKIVSGKSKNSKDVEIEFITPSTALYDDIMLVRKDGGEKKHNLEYKQDYRAFKTGNIVLEIIPHIEATKENGKFVTPDFSIRDYIILSDSDHQQICTFCDIKQNSKISRHFAEEEYLFVYNIFDGSNLKETILFNGNKLNKYFVNNYKSRKFIVTNSSNNGSSWITIGALFGINEIISASNSGFVLLSH